MGLTSVDCVMFRPEQGQMESLTMKTFIFPGRAYSEISNNLVVFIKRKDLQPAEVFYKKGVLKKFTKFTRKHLCQSLFSFTCFLAL